MKLVANRSCLNLKYDFNGDEEIACSFQGRRGFNVKFRKARRQTDRQTDRQILMKNTKKLTFH